MKHILRMYGKYHLEGRAGIYQEFRSDLEASEDWTFNGFIRDPSYVFPEGRAKGKVVYKDEPKSELRFFWCATDKGESDYIFVLKEVDPNVRTKVLRIYSGHWGELSDKVDLKSWEEALMKADPKECKVHDLVKIELAKIK